MLPGRPTARWLLFAAAALAFWSVVVAATGGFVVDLGWLYFSSRTPRNSSVLAIVAGAIAWRLASEEERGAVRRFIRRVFATLDAMRVPSWVSPVLAGAASIGAVLLGFLRGAFVAGGSDVYGYVSQAHLFASGALRIEQTVGHSWTFPNAVAALVPHGYHLAPDGVSLAPIYSPGLSIVMMVFELAAGRDAVFWVVPVLAGAAVWTTYVLGTQLFNPLTGVAGAVLLLTSPVFILQTILPMSDVPVTAWWAMTLALLASPGLLSATAAGVTAGLAVLTRPNLVVLAAVCAIWLLWHFVVNRSPRLAARFFLFCVPVTVGCALVGWLNFQMRDSPFLSGYPALGLFFAWHYLPVNIRLFSAWIVEVAPALLAAPFGLFGPPSDSSVDHAARPRLLWLWLGIIATVLGAYAFYWPFNSWIFLRFLLPTFPMLLVLAVSGMVVLSGWMRIPIRGIIVTVVVTVLAWQGVRAASARGVFNIREGEQRFVIAGEYVTRRFPERAIFICDQHSGSLRYYSGRLTLRWETIGPDALDAAIEELNRLGYRPYLLFEDWEEAGFREALRGHSALAELDWPPVAVIDGDIQVRIYDPAHRVSPDPNLVTETVR